MEGLTCSHMLFRGRFPSLKRSKSCGKKASKLLVYHSPSSINTPDAEVVYDKKHHYPLCIKHANEHMEEFIADIGLEFYIHSIDIDKSKSKRDHGGS